MKSSWAH